jgi:hypothetical protein
MAIEKPERHNQQVLIKSQQKWLKQGVEQFTVRSIPLWIVCGIRRNCLRHGRSQSLYVPVYKKGNKTECSNYRSVSLLPTTYKILSNILLSRLTPYAEGIIGDHQCRLLHNKSVTWFQTFAVFWMLCAFCWVIHRHL